MLTGRNTTSSTKFIRFPHCRTPQTLWCGLFLWRAQTELEHSHRICCHEKHFRDIVWDARSKWAVRIPHDFPSGIANDCHTVMWSFVFCFLTIQWRQKTGGVSWILYAVTIILFAIASLFLIFLLSLSDSTFESSIALKKAFSITDATKHKTENKQ